MPIFSYKCKKCGKVFDFLSGVGQGAEIPTCPDCKSQQVEKLLASFGVRTGGSTGGSSCPTGSCPFTGNN